MNKVKILGVLAGVVLAVVAATGRADQPAKAAEPAAKPGVLTDAGLKTMLENLGYDPKEIATKEGGFLYRIEVKRGTWNFVLDVALSTDKTMLWVNSAVVQLPPTEKVPAAVLENMLRKSDELGPTHFAVKASRFVYLNVPMQNKDVTPAVLRKMIEGLADDVKGTEDVWNQTKWPGADAAKADAPKAEKKD